MKEKGFVYLLLVIDDNLNEYYKVGITKNNPLKRISNLQTGNYNKIDLLYYYESFNYKKIEKYIHTRYILKKTSADNEWFSLDTADVINFLIYCKNGDDLFENLKKENPFT